MKRFLCLILSLFSVFTLVACSRDKGEAPLGMKNASSETVDFYLYVPDNWTVNTEKNGLMVSARAPEGDPSNITMVGFADGQDKYETIDDFWDYYKGEFESRIFDKITDSESGEIKSSFNLTNDGEVPPIDGRAAKKYEYSGKIAGSDFSYMQIIINNGNIFYILTYTSTPTFYSKNDDEIELIVKYLEFK